MWDAVDFSLICHFEEEMGVSAISSLAEPDILVVALWGQYGGGRMSLWSVGDEITK